MRIYPARAAVISSVLTRPNNTTAYSQNDLIASNVTAGSIVVPSLIVPQDDCEVIEVVKGVLFTNLTTGFTTFAGHIDLWTAPPTFTNGDNGAYAVATGWANWVGHLTTATSDAFSASGDGAALAAANGSSFGQAGYTPAFIARKKGDLLYWSLRETDATGFTPIGNQTFTLALSILQH